MLLMNSLSGQKEDHQWIYHFGAIDTVEFPFASASVLDFNYLPPKVEVRNEVLIFLKESHASVCDENGELLLYSNAQTVYGPNHEFIEGGDTINHSRVWDNFFLPVSGEFVTTGLRGIQQVGFIPQPDTDTMLVLYQDRSDFNLDPELNDMRLLMSKVTSDTPNNFRITSKDILVNENIRPVGSITACRHANGRDWWLLQFGQSEVFTYLIDPDGLRLSFVEELPFTLKSPSLGQAKFSPLGDKFALIGLSETNTSDGLELLLSDFDRNTGRLVEPDLYFLDSSDNFISTGLAFSPSGDLLYYSSLHSIQQLDLTADDIIASIEVIAEHNGINNCQGIDLGALTLWGQMQLAPDNKIYISLSAQCSDVHVIHQPDVRGVDCDMEQNAIILPTFVFGTIPTFNTLRLGPLDGSPSDTLDLDNHPVSRFWYEQDSVDFLTSQFWDVSYFRPESWEWDFGDGMTSVERFPQHTYSGSGIYEVCLTVSNENSSNTSCQTLNLGMVSTTEETLEYDISVFPNPTSDFLRMTFHDYLPRHASVVFYDLSGAQVLTHSLIGGANIVDLTSLVSGTYVYEVRDQGVVIGGGKVVRL